jgi:ATP-dependent DNA helicase RecG
MARNGSPPPRFSTDEGRTYFLAELPVHPELPGVGQAHDKAHDEAHDEPLSETAEQILVLLATAPRSRAELTGALGIKSSRAGHFLRAVEQIRRLGLAELTIPDKPQSRNQKMRITEAGRAWLVRTPRLPETR